MIDNILGNRTNILVLRFLTRFKDQFFSADEIAKETSAGLKNVYDTLKMLSYEGLISEKKLKGKIYYKYIVDSSTKESIFRIFEEERRKVFLHNNSFYKIISELESNIVKIAGSDLVDIILYGSLAKGSETINSDIDLCVLIQEDDPGLKKKIIGLSFENKFDRDLQIQVFSSKEFLSANKNPLVQNIMREGLSLKMG